MAGNLFGLNESPIVAQRTAVYEGMLCDHQMSIDLNQEKSEGKEFYVFQRILKISRGFPQNGFILYGYGDY